MEDLLQTISTTSGDNSNVATTLINFGADLIGVRGVGDDPLYSVDLGSEVNLLPPETETTPLNVELISTEDFEKLTDVDGDVGATDDDLATDFSAFDNTQTDSSVVGGYDEAGMNVLTTENEKDTEVVSGYDEAGLNAFGGLLNQDYTDLTDSDFQGLDLTEGGNTVGYATSGDNAGSAAIVTPEGNIEIIGPGSTETGVVFTGETAVDDAIDYLTGAGEGEDGEEEINGAGSGTGGDGSGDGEGSGSGTGDGEGDGSGQEEVVDDTVIETDPIDSYRVDPNFAVRDLMADFQRRRKGGTGYGLPKYMQRYMSGEIVDELVRRVELDDGTILYQTPDGRYLDPKEFINAASIGDEQSVKIGDEEYQTGYTTTNLNTGDVVRYDIDGNLIVT